MIMVLRKNSCFSLSVLLESYIFYFSTLQATLFKSYIFDLLYFLKTISSTIFLVSSRIQSSFLKIRIGANETSSQELIIILPLNKKKKKNTYATTRRLSGLFGSTYSWMSGHSSVCTRVYACTGRTYYTLQLIYFIVLHT